jgi:FkbM family methyltransferase
MTPWTVQFISRWRPYLTFPSILRLRRVLIREGTGGTRPGAEVSLALKRPFPFRFNMRVFGSDFDTVREIIVDEVYRSVCRNLPNCKTIIDLGANIGLASLYLAHFYPQARLICVEPSAETFDLLRRNLSPLASAGRCELVNAALWHKNEKVYLTQPTAQARYDALKVAAERGPACVETDGVTLGSILERFDIKQVDLLKVDIEGAETNLFSGDLSWIQSVNAIAIEFHGDSRQVSRFDERMREYGFAISDESPHTVLASRVRSGLAAV